MPYESHLQYDVGQVWGGGSIRSVPDLSQPSVNDPRVKPESEKLSLSRKHPAVSQVLTGRKAQQIHETEIPVNVYSSRFVDNLGLDILGEEFMLPWRQKIHTPLSMGSLHKQLP